MGTWAEHQSPTENRAGRNVLQHVIGIGAIHHNKYELQTNVHLRQTLTTLSSQIQEYVSQVDGS